MHRNSQENQLMKSQKTSKSHPALLSSHSQLQTSQDFVSAWCRCQTFPPATRHPGSPALLLPQAEGEQAVALGSRAARMVKMAVPCCLLRVRSTGLAANTTAATEETGPVYEATILRRGHAGGRVGSGKGRAVIASWPAILLPQPREGMAASSPHASLMSVSTPTT